MLRSLIVKNYRNLKDLKINSIGRINLITGKNNSGKSTLLEAISIYSTKGDIGWIYNLLDERGESYKNDTNSKSTFSSNLKAVSSLFSDRVVSFDPNESIYIGTIDNTLFGQKQSTEDFTALKFIKYIYELIDDSNIEISERTILRRQRIVLDNDNANDVSDYKVGLEVKSGNSQYLIPLEEERPYRSSYRSRSILSESVNFQYVRTRNIDNEVSSKLWDSIALTEKETYVIDALRIIEPSVERVAFIGDEEYARRQRTTVIKLKGKNTVLPLKSMGDGINRILTIILALVNSDNGYLLIDEFENGLHYSVQEKLWKIIFTLAGDLNIQIFATTHSDDCIRAFESVLNTASNKADGKMFRLDNINGQIKPVEFDAQELKIAADHDIETR